MQRIVPLNTMVCMIIDKQARKNEYVFNLSNRQQPNVFTNTIEKIKKATGIDWHFHLLRHAFATKLMEKGVDLVTIGSILGHSKISISLIYSHTSEKKKKQAVGSLDTFEDT